MKGFTLIELVMVMVLVGILAIAVVPRFSSQSTFTARAFADQSKSMVRYAQKLAIAQNRNVYVRLNGVNIALCFDAACATVVPPPAAVTTASGSCTTNWFCATSPSGVAYAVAPATPSFYFSPLGKPFNPGDIPPATTFNAPVTITITAGTFTSSFTVARETGYVY
jgi:MSHA pilin protein MshC